MHRWSTLSLLLLMAVVLLGAYSGAAAAVAGDQITPCEAALEALRNSKSGNTSKAGSISKSSNSTPRATTSGSRMNHSPSLIAFIVPNATQQAQNATKNATKSSNSKNNTPQSSSATQNAALPIAAAVMTGVVIICLI